LGSEHAYGYRNKLTPHHDKPKLVTPKTQTHTNTPCNPVTSNPPMAGC
jgi:hypothetical protein